MKKKLNIVKLKKNTINMKKITIHKLNKKSNYYKAYLLIKT